MFADGPPKPVVINHEIVDGVYEIIDVKVRTGSY